MRLRVTLKWFIIILFTMSSFMLYIFNRQLQQDISKRLKSSYSGKLLRKPGKNVHLKQPRWEDSNVPYMEVRMGSKANKNGLQINTKRPYLEMFKTTELTIVEDSCYLSAQDPNRTFQKVDPYVYVYSAYLDERLPVSVVRIMAMFGILPVLFCYFNVDKPRTEWISVKGTFHQMCENHDQMFGGFIITCNVPGNVTNVCSIGVYQNSSNVVYLSVTRLESKHAVHWRMKREAFLLSDDFNGSHIDLAVFDQPKLQYNYSICIPPLFGNIKTIQLIEFVELHRIIGFQHFIFYFHKVDNPEILEVLRYYESLDVATVINWKLPINGMDEIWYNGQLNSHNDCMYRAMSFSKYVAIIDIDEAVVPHDGHLKINEALENLLKDENTCGLSFNSAFYGSEVGPGREEDNILSSLSYLERSQFSSVLTKVMVSPLKIFDVGIHHVNKPLLEQYKILKIDQSTAFLHHYRECDSDYDIDCNKFVKETSMLRYNKSLIENVQRVFLDALSQNVFQKKIAPAVW